MTILSQRNQAEVQEIKPTIIPITCEEMSWALVDY